MKHEFDAPDFARRADHIEPDHSAGPWKHRPHPQKHGASGWLVFVLAALMALLIALIVGNILAKAVTNLAVFNAGGAW